MAEQELSGAGLEQFYDYIAEVKELISSDIWGNIFLNCTKNEVLILWLLYRKGEVNMSQIAEYIHVPLNTATGIIGRMEKNEMICRMRAKEDKRIVLISFTEKGRLQFQTRPRAEDSPSSPKQRMMSSAVNSSGRRLKASMVFC